MRLLAASEVPRSAARDRVFRPWRHHAVLAFGLFVALTAACLGWPWLAPVLGFEQELPTWVTTSIGTVLLLFVWIAWRSLKASLRADSWLLRAAFDGLYLRFRSHLNFELPAEDPAVVFIPRTRVASLRAHRVKMKRSAEVEGERAPLGGEKYLEIHLDDDDADGLGELREALARERAKRGDGRGGGGTVALHYPVRVLSGGVIEIDWAGIRPGLRRAVGLLGRSYPLLQEEVSQAPRLEDMPPEERRERLRVLVQRGERILALQLARKFYGYDTTQAQAFLDDLVR